jgi:hypothetical protein
LAAIFDSFSYVNRYSEELTWGDDIPARETDSLSIIDNLMIDVSNVKLQKITIEEFGKLLFSDEKDIFLNVTELHVKGSLSVGSSSEQRKSKLIISFDKLICD